MRTAIMIVCNGEPFISAQLKHIYNVVDEIIIIEGADPIFQTIIGSKNSTDGTIESIQNYPDSDNKIKLIHFNGSKNHMVKEGARHANGEFLYMVDADEFMLHDNIEIAFDMLNEVDSVQVPQRWYYKWQDVYLKSNRENGIVDFPSRFFRSYPDLYPSHIPWNGYKSVNDDKQIECKAKPMDINLYGHHYLCLYEFQMINKMSYYAKRGDASWKVCKNKYDEWIKIKRDDATNGKPITSYRNMTLCVDGNPSNFGLPDTFVPHGKRQ